MAIDYGKSQNQDKSKNKSETDQTANLKPRILTLWMSAQLSWVGNFTRISVWLGENCGYLLIIYFCTS